MSISIARSIDQLIDLSIKGLVAVFVLCSGQRWCYNGVVLAAAGPAELLLEELLHLERSVGVDEARVLVHRAVALLQGEVREGPVVADLQEDAHELLGHELVDVGL